MIKSISLKLRFLLLLVFIISNSFALLAQVDIKKSNEVRVINEKEYYIHIVERGHTLYSLARVYKIPMDEIIFENPAAKKLLFVGQELKIPVNSRDEAVDNLLRNNSDKFFYHVSKKGESLNGIAGIYSITKAELKKANPKLSDPLKTGQYIKIPVSAKKTSLQPDQSPKKEPLVLKPKQKTPLLKSNEHIVKAGENLYRIALNFQLSIEDLFEANPGLTKILTIGQRIKIPVKKKENDFIIHKVKRRGKLSRIARNYNVDIQVLKKVNPHIGEKTKAGDIIRIPLHWELEVEEPIVVESESAIEEITLETIINQDSLQCLNDVENDQNSYKIALMIPLYLEEVDSLKFTENTNVDDLLDQRPFRFLQYYYGTKMAVDSMNALGMNIELSVFDVDNSIGKTIKVLQDSSLQEQDLIIGPFFSRSFKLASHFAKIFEIPIVNPLSERSEIIEDNPFVFKFKSKNSSQYTQVRNLIATNYRDAKLFLVKHNEGLIERDFPLYISEIHDLLDSGYYVSNEDIFDLIIEKSMADTTTINISREFIATFDTLTGITTEIDSIFIEDEFLEFISLEGNVIVTDSIEFNLYDSTYIKNEIVPFYYSTDSIYAFTNQASIFRDNVVIVFTDDNVFALDLMTKLNIERDTFSTYLVGLPNWQQFTNMDNEILSNLKAHILVSSFVNYDDGLTKKFIRNFRKQHLTEPMDYAFKGFDVSWFFLNALKSYGINFMNCLPYYSSSYIQSKMDFEKANEEGGFENCFWKILKYDRYQLNEIEVHFPNPPVTTDNQ